MTFSTENDNIQEDIVLIEESKKEIKNFEGLYRRHYVAVYRFVDSKVADNDTVKDIVSQVFIKAMLNIKQFKNRGIPFHNWLFKIALNEINMHYRKQNITESYYVHCSIDNDFFIETNIYSDSITDPYVVLEKLLSILPKFEIDLLIMKYFEKRPYSEIANILNVSEGVLKVRVHRIIQKLKEEANKKKYAELIVNIIGLLIIYLIL
jgi:RNA polymerase sigma-70 factor (ECF subfamily)